MGANGTATGARAALSCEGIGHELWRVDTSGTYKNGHVQDGAGRMQECLMETN